MAGNEDIVKITDSLLSEIGSGEEKVILLLNALQRRFQYLPEAALKRIAERCHLPPARIMGVATFYSAYRLKPAGSHRIKICVGTACHVKGAETLLDGFRKYLNISEDQDTDEKGLFTLEKVSCLGCCMLAPAVQIDDTIYGYVETKKIPSVIRDFLASRVGRQGKKSWVFDGKQVAGIVKICTCSSCLAAGSGEVLDEIRSYISHKKYGVEIREVGCTGISYEAPLIKIELPEGSFTYGRLGRVSIPGILDHHFRHPGMIPKIEKALFSFIDQLLWGEDFSDVVRYAVDLRPGQVHLATQYCGELDPLDLEAYKRHGGFSGWDKAIKLSPLKGIELLEASGLRGRGGAGYPTGKKWRTVFEAKGEFVICNGDEGDPGAFMDRMLLESFPFRVLEGIAIAGRILGARKGYLYIREEYPLAVRRVRQAIAVCGENGYLAKNEEEGFSIEVIEGAGAFVCGEETALIAAIEGKRGMPRYKPPYPATRGLWGKPTLINNVETFALVPFILEKGPEEFRKYGTPGSPGTKTFALAGKIKKGGLIEVPMGITLREIVFDMGGGIQDGRELKAIQVGGPSGGCIPASMVDLPVDFDDLKKADAIMGSGGMIVLDDSDCMVDLACYFMAFTQAESCGKCTYCRIGTKEMLYILEKLTKGEGAVSDLEHLEALAVKVGQRSVCGLGRTAPNPVLSTLKYFREEYLAHIQGKCPAGKCRALTTYRITGACIGCTRCAQVCPVGAVTSVPFERHSIDPAVCTRCDSCRPGCPEKAIIVE